MATRVEVEYYLGYIRSDLVLFDRMFSIFARPQETWQETSSMQQSGLKIVKETSFGHSKSQLRLTCPV